LDLRLKELLPIFNGHHKGFITCESCDEYESVDICLNPFAPLLFNKEASRNLIEANEAMVYTPGLKNDRYRVQSSPSDLARVRSIVLKHRLDANP